MFVGLDLDLESKGLKIPNTKPTKHELRMQNKSCRKKQT